MVTTLPFLLAVLLGCETTTNPRNVSHAMPTPTATGTAMPCGRCPVPRRRWRRPRQATTVTTGMPASTPTQTNLTLLTTGSTTTAMAVADGGDTVCVGPGTYVDNVHFNGRDVKLIGVAGRDATTIMGADLGSVVSFDNREGPDATLRGGLGPDAGRQLHASGRGRSGDPRRRRHALRHRLTRGAAGAGLVALGRRGASTCQSARRPPTDTATLT